jgi:hypothetical protein
MADERQFGTQELVSAKYFVQPDESDEPQVEESVRRAPPRRSGLENTVRLLTPLVIIMLVAAAGGVYWQNRSSIASKARDLKGRRCVVDWVFWACGSKTTFNKALSDRIERAQRDSAFQFDHAKSPFKSEFENVDFSNLTNSWNGAWNEKKK